MGRLTYKVKMKNGKERVSFDCVGSFAETAQILADKLAHYEDLEEQGRLIELPTSVGQIIWTNQRLSGWYYRLKDAPYRVTVEFIGLNNSEEFGGGFINVSYEKHDHMMQFRFSDIGKTVFLTEEEAEKALAEMG